MCGKNAAFKPLAANSMKGMRRFRRFAAIGKDSSIMPRVRSLLPDLNQAF